MLQAQASFHSLCLQPLLSVQLLSSFKLIYKNKYQNPSSTRIVTRSCRNAYVLSNHSIHDMETIQKLLHGLLA